MSIIRATPFSLDIADMMTMLAATAIENHHDDLIDACHNIEVCETCLMIEDALNMVHKITNALGEPAPPLPYAQARFN